MVVRGGRRGDGLTLVSFRTASMILGVYCSRETVWKMQLQNARYEVSEGGGVCRYLVRLTAC